MPVPTTLASLSTTAASNSPSGGENPFPDLDDHIRAGYAFDAQNRDAIAAKLDASAVSAYMLTVLNDADAPTARATLGAVGLTGDQTVAGVKTFSSPPVSSAAASAANELVRKVEFDAAVAATVPAGAVQAFAMSSAPTGWLKANGEAVSRTTYATLFAAIGTTFGAGDGSTTFNLPDLRGEFVRGWDDGRGVDSGRGFGTAQADEFEAHYHDVRTNSATGSGTGGGGYFISNAGVGDMERTRATPSGGSETRPRNVALLYCIKT